MDALLVEVNRVLIINDIVTVVTDKLNYTIKIAA